MKLLDRLRQEWTTLRAAPIAIALIVIVVCVITFLLARRGDAPRQPPVTERATLQSAAPGVDPRAYPEFTPAPAHRFDKLSNQALREETLSVTKDLNDLLARGQKQQRKVEDQHERNADPYSVASRQVTAELLDTYDRSYKGKVLALRAELRKRVKDPETVRPPPAMPAFDLLYEHPANPTGVQTIADALEAYASRL